MNKVLDWKTDPVQVSVWIAEQAQRLHACGLTYDKASQMVFNRALQLRISPDVLRTALSLLDLNIEAEIRFLHMGAS